MTRIFTLWFALSLPCPATSRPAATEFGSGGNIGRQSAEHGQFLRIIQIGKGGWSGRQAEQEGPAGRAGRQTGLAGRPGRQAGLAGTRRRSLAIKSSRRVCWRRRRCIKFGPDCSTAVQQQQQQQQQRGPPAARPAAALQQGLSCCGLSVLQFSSLKSRRGSGGRREGVLRDRPSLVKLKQM